MKKFYVPVRKSLIAFFLTTMVVTSGKSQVLSAGDIAFTGYLSTDATERFSFVLLVNIPAGTVINFTENGWLIPPTATPAQFRASEFTVTWTSATALAAGREITISGTGGVAGATALVSGSNISPGTCTGPMPSLSFNGDQVLAYQGAAASPTFISGIHMNVITAPNTTAAAWDGTANTSNASALPPGLITGTNAIWIGTTGDINSRRNNARFNCTGPLTTAAQVRAAVNNQANWTTELAPTGPASFTLPSGCAFLASIFPVDLVNFAGNSNSNSIGLNWQTANEANDNGSYEIEKSADGVNFSNIGRVNAQGFSYLPNNYTFTDNAPLNGANFYRLKIVSNNGSVKYSFVVKVLFGRAGRGIMISPNPAVSEFTLTTAGSDYTQLVISDRNGRTVLQQRLSGNNHRIDVSKLPAGQYSVTAFGASEKTTEKLLIVH